MHLALLAAAAQSIAPAPPSPVEAVERQRDTVRDAISPCRRAVTEEEIVVCGQRGEDSHDLARSPLGGAAYQRWSAPASGPWFEIRRGPLSIGCCSVEGGHGTGAGLGLRLRF